MARAVIPGAGRILRRLEHAATHSLTIMINGREAQTLLEELDWLRLAATLNRETVAALTENNGMLQQLVDKALERTDDSPEKAAG